MVKGETYNPEVVTSNPSLDTSWIIFIFVVKTVLWFSKRPKVDENEAGNRQYLFFKTTFIDLLN